MTGSLTGTVTAPRFRHVLPFLQELADDLGLGFAVLWHDRGWWSDTIRFQFNGEEELLKRAKVALKTVEELYNG